MPAATCCAATAAAALCCCCQLDLLTRNQPTHPFYLACPPPHVCRADGFGSEGLGTDVPPGATLEVELTLLSWKKVEKVTGEL